MAEVWPDLLDRLANLGGIADVLTVAELDPRTRRLSLLRVARDCEEAAASARVLADVQGAESAAGDPADVGMSAIGQHAEALHLGRDLDALTGARLLMETVPDREFTATMLRLVVRHGEFAAERARVLLAGMGAGDAVAGAAGGGS